jgi:hypothetical protein
MLTLFDCPVLSLQTQPSHLLPAALACHLSPCWIWHASSTSTPPSQERRCKAERPSPGRAEAEAPRARQPKTAPRKAEGFASILGSCFGCVRVSSEDGGNLKTEQGTLQASYFKCLVGGWILLLRLEIDLVEGRLSWLSMRRR